LQMLAFGRAGAWFFKSLKVKLESVKTHPLFTLRNMMILIACILLPSLVLGIQIATTENWENNEDTFTLKHNNNGPVKVSLSGPYDTRSTTEDPIIPLILRKLIQDRINNEIEQENKTKNSNKIPLVYMTPPSRSKSTTSSSQEEQDDDLTTTEDPTSDEISSTTTDSGEIDDFDTTTANIIIKPKLIGPLQPVKITKINDEDWDDNNSSEEKGDKAQLNNNNIKTPLLKTEQYAEKYQSYLPQVSSSPEPIKPVNDDTSSEDETSTPQTTPQNVPTPPSSNTNQPVYYFYLRPRPAPMSPQYPQQQRMMTMYPPYKFPTFIAQDYQSQMPLPSTNTQAYIPYRRTFNNFPQDITPMGSNIYPQYQQQSPNMYNPYMSQSQMYPMSTYPQYSPTMVSRPMYPMYNNYRVPSYPYNSNYDGNNYYQQSSSSYPYPMMYNYNYNNGGMGMTPRYYYSSNSVY
jgi:hypothetical protein